MRPKLIAGLRDRWLWPCGGTTARATVAAYPTEATWKLAADPEVVLREMLSSLIA